jgi:hypothetical protein
MRVHLSAMVVLLACGSNETLPAASPPTPPPMPSDPGSQALTSDECKALGQQMLDVCTSRGNDRSAQADGYCSNLLHSVGDSDSWVKTDCVPYVRYIDAVCFRSATNVGALMDCDRSVDRTTAATHPSK